MSVERLLDSFSSPQKEVVHGLLSANCWGGRALEDLMREEPALFAWLNEGRSTDNSQQFDVSQVNQEAVAAQAQGVPDGIRALDGVEAAGFLFGVFEGLAGCFRDSEGTPILALNVRPSSVREMIQQHCGAAAETKDALTYSGVSALDALGRIYDGEFGSIGTALARQYRKWCRHVIGFTSEDEEPGGEIFVERTQENGVIPHKERVSDSGYDVTIIDVKKNLSAVILYGTGIRVEPPQGWYFDVVPRSSIIKRGYMLANNVGVIDRAYRGELMIPLVKVDPAAPPLELPVRIAQLIPRPIVHFPVREVESLSLSDRGEKGFGSSGR